jgi:hypothetical protein
MNIVCGSLLMALEEVRWGARSRLRADLSCRTKPSGCSARWCDVTWATTPRPCTSAHPRARARSGDAVCGAARCRCALMVDQRVLEDLFSFYQPELRAHFDSLEACARPRAGQGHRTSSRLSTCARAGVHLQLHRVVVHVPVRRGTAAARPDHAVLGRAVPLRCARRTRACNGLVSALTTGQATRCCS